jgi:hypothetical protein
MSPTPLDHLQGPQSKANDFHIQSLTTSRAAHPLFPPQHRTSLGHIGTGLRDTTAPSAIMWTPIYGRLGTRRLGTVILCISL